MKKLLAILLCLCSLFVFASCGNKEYELPWDHFCYTAEENSSVVELEGKDKNYIIDLLNDAKWTNDLAKCPADYKFYTKKQEVGYNAESGVFNDYTGKKSTTLSEVNRVRVNDILGVSKMESVDIFANKISIYDENNINDKLSEILTLLCMNNGGMILFEDYSTFAEYGLQLDFNEEFFETKNLLVFVTTACSSDDMEYQKIKVSDGKLYPHYLRNYIPEGDPVTDDFILLAYYAEIDKSADYEIGTIIYEYR